MKKKKCNDEKKCPKFCQKRNGILMEYSNIEKMNNKKKESKKN